MFANESLRHEAHLMRRDAGREDRHETAVEEAGEYLGICVNKGDGSPVFEGGEISFLRQKGSASREPGLRENTL